MSEIPKPPGAIRIDSRGFSSSDDQLILHYAAVARVAVEALRVTTEALRRITDAGWTILDKRPLQDASEALAKIEASGWTP